MELNFVLVCKSGGCYTAEYVNRLAAVLAPYGRVTCLTDMPEGMDCRTLPLFTDLPSWWAKLEMFARFRSGRNVYFDLDTVITGDITPLIEMPGPFAMLQDFYYPGRLASGVMVWDGDYSRILRVFKPEYMGRYAALPKLGDQAYIADQLTQCRVIQEEVPGLVASYKVDSEEARKAAAIVCYHGLPRPHEMDWNA